MLALMSMSLVLYDLRGSNGACLRFDRLASVILVSMKTEYFLKNADTSWMKLSMEFPSSLANNNRASLVRFLAKKRQ